MSSSSATLPLHGKIALITGSSRSIGASIAKRLARDGASVVINYKSNADAANALVSEIHATTPGKAIALAGDMSSGADAQNLIEETVKHFSGLDILVLNAGLMENVPLNGVDEEAFDAHFNTNVKVPLFMVKTASKYLKAGTHPHSHTHTGRAYTLMPGGRVFFVSTSLTKFSGVPADYLLYAATKGSVEQMTRVLSKDLGARGINVNAIAPGPTNTELFRNGKSEQLINFFCNLHPQKRIAEADEISPIIAMLSRDEASWINGQTIFVNGVSASTN